MQLSERDERRTANNKAMSDQVATSNLYANIKQYFGEAGQEVVSFLQVGRGERPTFDEACKSWLLSPEHLAEVQREARKEPFSAFTPLHEAWVQATVERYTMLVMAL
jgi:hypothetical protein